MCKLALLTNVKSIIRIAIASFLFLFYINCSNSNYSDSIDTPNDAITNNNEQQDIDTPNDAVTNNNEQQNPETYLFFNDNEYPYAGLPQIVIETQNFQDIKDINNKIPAKFQIWEKGIFQSDVINMTIKGRGNTSWNEMPKKGYKIEFADKIEILGMPADKDWALIANYADKTLMKNHIVNLLSKKLGLFYVPQDRFVELYLNGKYLGVYIIIETIKISKNRINAQKNENSYIVEFDCHLRSNEQFVVSNILSKEGMVYQVHYPKNATQDQLQEIANQIHSFEQFLIELKNEEFNDIEKWIDLDEYIKYYWIQEFSKNPDAEFLTSVFFVWGKGGKIKMGPIWDFDLAFGGSSVDKKNFTEGWHIRPAYWNNYLFKDATIKNLSRKFWLDNRKTFVNVLNNIDSLAELLYPATVNNFKKWDVLGSTELRFHRNAYNSYDEAIKDLKTWISKRIEWIDKQYQE